METTTDKIYFEYNEGRFSLEPGLTHLNEPALSVRDILGNEVLNIDEYHIEQMKNKGIDPANWHSVVPYALERLQLADKEAFVVAKSNTIAVNEVERDSDWKDFIEERAGLNRDKFYEYTYDIDKYHHLVVQMRFLLGSYIHPLEKEFNENPRVVNRDTWEEQYYNRIVKTRIALKNIGDQDGWFVDFCVKEFYKRLEQYRSKGITVVGEIKSEFLPSERDFLNRVFDDLNEAYDVKKALNPSTLDLFTTKLKLESEEFKITNLSETQQKQKLQESISRTIKALNEIPNTKTSQGKTYDLISNLENVLKETGYKVGESEKKKNNHRIG